MFSYLSFFFKIVINSSWLISMSINSWDIKALMLLSLLLANIRILSCFFFLFLVIVSNFLNIPVFRENIRVKLALPIPTDAPIILVNEIIDIPPQGGKKPESAGVGFPRNKYMSNKVRPWLQSKLLEKKHLFWKTPRMKISSDA